MTPTFALERVPTPLGEMLILTDDRDCLRALDWTDCEPRMHRLLRRQYSGDLVTLVPRHTASGARDAVLAYFAGDLGAIDAVAVEAGGTAFQREVWAALRRIPRGRTLTYAALAAEIGRPSAIRAVGLANGANPVGIVVPCHRVIGSDASLTGYAGGVARKRWLLAHEGVELAGARRGRAA